MSCLKPRQNTMSAVFHGNVALTLQTCLCRDVNMNSQMKNSVIGIERPFVLLSSPILFKPCC